MGTRNPISKPTLNPALRTFWRTRARVRVLYGGRMSGKSWDAAGVAIMMAQSMRLRFLCARQFQNRIEDSVFTLLKVQIERFGLQSKFEIQKNKIICITTGSEFVFYGLWRSIDEIKSLEGIDVCWLEEAHSVTETQWLILEATLRKQDSQFWIIFNPRLSTDFVYKRFVAKPPADTIVRKQNWTDNPYLSATALKVIHDARAEDYEQYLHVYEGVPRDDDEHSVIRRSHLMTALDAHLKLGIEIRGARRIGFDVADAGEDACAMIEAHGSLALWADTWRARDDELLKSCSRVWQAARTRQASVIYDAIGVGATAGAKFNELNVGQDYRVQHTKFFAGGAVMKPDSQYRQSGVKNKDFFSNVKAQAWWCIADRLRNTYAAVTKGQIFPDDEMIFIASDMPYLDQLMDELSTPKQDYDQAGRVKVESKKDLAKREVASPNLADAFVMAFPPETSRPMQINPSLVRAA